LRRLGAQNFIEWWSFDAAGARAAVEGEAAHFRAIGEGVEWKVYSHDGPAGLEGELARAGFEPDELETFMVFDLEGGTLEGTAAEGVEVRRVADAGGLADLMATSAAAFGREQAWLAAELEARLADPTLGLYVAYIDGRSGRFGEAGDGARKGLRRALRRRSRAGVSRQGDLPGAGGGAGAGGAAAGLSLPDGRRRRCQRAHPGAARLRGPGEGAGVGVGGLALRRAPFVSAR
jgi:hypothetical protein